MSKHLAVLALLAVVAACSKPPSAGQHSAAAGKQVAQTGQTNQAARAALPSNEFPPMKNGVYVSHETCPGEGGCPWKHWRANKPIELHASGDANSPLVTTLKPGEWAEVLGGETRMVPVRGVMRRAAQSLKPGDVVYMIGSAGEGTFDLWHRGEIVELQSPDDDDALIWDDGEPVAAASAASAAGPASSSLGWWVHVKRETDGVTGWVFEPDGFDCMGPLAGDEGCKD